MTSTDTRDGFDLVVLGAGEAGTIVASLAFESGHSVALVYREPWGSTCLNVGCVPSKFLIHRARVAHLTRTAGRFGVRAGDPTVDLRAIVEEKRATVDGHRAVSWKGALSAPGLELLEGEARFVSRRQVRVGERILEAERIFIATGMRPLIPPVPGLEDGPFLTNEGGDVARHGSRAFDRHRWWIHRMRAWAGVRRFGSQGTIVQRGDRLIGEKDQDASTVLGRAFADEGTTC